MAHQYSRRFERLGRTVTRHSALVLLAWIAVAAVLNIAFPQLEAVTKDHAVSPMPADAPAMRTIREMGEKFGQDGFDNSAIVVMASPKGFSPNAQVHYRAAVDRLRADKPAVRFVQDVIGDPLARSTPAARDRAMSEDGHAWIVMAGLQGRLGSPDSFAALQRVRSTVQQSFAGSDVTAHVTGPSATFADMADKAMKDLVVITVIVGLSIATILLIVYRSFFTATLPLIVMGISIFVTRGVISALGTTGVLPLSALSSALMMSILAGACVNYTVFLISRYHERIRAGAPPSEALAHASGSISMVTLAAAATVIIGNLAQLTATLKMLAVVGPVIAIAVTVAFLANITLAQAVLALAAKRGWGMPRKDLTRRYWHRVGIFVVRRPAATLTASLLVLALLGGSAGLVRFGYDDRAMVADLQTDSTQGYQVLDEYFNADALIPQFVMVTATKDLRTPHGLADLDQMAQRMSQVPGVSKVVGITRPDGNKLTQATLAWQIGLIGQQVDRAQHTLSTELQPQLTQMVDIAELVSSMMTEFNDNDLQQLQRVIPQLLTTAQTAATELNRHRPVIESLGKADDLVGRLDAVGLSVDALVNALKNVVNLTPAARQALDANPACPADSQCAQLGQWLSAIAGIDRDGLLTDIDALGKVLNKVSTTDSVTELIDKLSAAVEQIQPRMNNLSSLERKYHRAEVSLQKLRALGVTTDSMRAMGERTRELASQMQDTMGAMTQAAAFLQTVGHDAAEPSASGFYLPQGLLDDSDFTTAAQSFITADGTAALYLIQSTVNPYSTKAVDMVRELQRVGDEARPNTELAGAEIGIGGYPALNADLQAAVSRDFKEIVVVTLLIITVIMCLLLRAIVAPLYLIATVVLTYLGSLGMGVLLFQVLLGQQIYWAIPTMTFVMTVAVGADYNILFVSRLREESTKSIRLGTIRTVAHTGSVITSAGTIFAAAMFGMMAGSMQNVVQIGFIIGFGLILDTFVVRTLVVPAISTLLGRKIWWPAKS